MIKIFSRIVTSLTNITFTKDKDDELFICAKFRFSSNLFAEVIASKSFYKGEPGAHNKEWVVSRAKMSFRVGCIGSEELKAVLMNWLNQILRWSSFPLNDFLFSIFLF